jgi:hypothetical protein
MTYSIGAQSSTVQHHAHSDPSYLRYLEELSKLTENLSTPIFRVKVATKNTLSQIFLNNIDPSIRQIYNCRTCLKFIDKYGGLVTVDPNTAQLVSILWNAVEAPSYLRQADAELQDYVQQQRIQGPFFARPGTLGTPVTGNFHHFSCLVPASAFCTDKEPHVKEAEVRQEYRNLRINLSSYHLNVFEDAANFIATCGDALHSCKTTADYMLSLKRLQATTGKNAYDNTVWLSLAKAPKPAFHLNTTIYGVILDSFAKGVAIDRLRQQLKIYQDPLKLRRPTVAPTEQAIKSATKLVQERGLTDALPRRFARFDEIPPTEIVWRPTLKDLPDTEKDPFANIVPKDNKNLRQAVNRRLEHLSNPPASSESVSLTHFLNYLLPLADALYLVNVPRTAFPFGALTAPAVDNAPPILQWDVYLSKLSDNTIRNPFGHFVFHEPQPLNRPHLLQVPNPSTYLYPVEAVIPLPPNWYGAQLDGDYKGVILYLKHAIIKETQHNGLFPAFLPSDLHGLSSVIEAYAKKNPLPPSDDQVAGVFMTNRGLSSGAATQLCLTRGRISTVYKISSVK